MTTISHILQTHPTDLYKEFDKYFEEENWLGWDPEVLIEEFPELRETSGQDDDIARDKLLAIHSVVSSPNVPLQDFRAFEKVALAFNNQHVVSDAIQPVDVEELTYAVRELRKLLKEAHGVEIEFTGEIPHYVATSAQVNGWVALPTELSFAQETFNRLAGLGLGGTRYNENKGLVDAARLLADQLVTANQDITALDVLSDETKENIVAQRLLGASLYDPTLLNT